MKQNEWASFYSSHSIFSQVTDLWNQCVPNHVFFKVKICKVLENRPSFYCRLKIYKPKTEQFSYFIVGDHADSGESNPIWNYFTRDPESDNVNCNICTRSITVRKGYSLSRLYRHVRLHPLVYKNVLQEKTQWMERRHVFPTLIQFANLL